MLNENSYSTFKIQQSSLLPKPYLLRPEIYLALSLNPDYALEKKND